MTKATTKATLFGSCVGTGKGSTSGAFLSGDIDAHVLPSQVPLKRRGSGHDGKGGLRGGEPHQPVENEGGSEGNRSGPHDGANLHQRAGRHSRHDYVLGAAVSTAAQR